MDAQEINKVIKKRGYFEVIFEPKALEENSICPRKLDCKKIVENAQIRLRGWYYPHVPHEENDSQAPPYVFEHGIESWVNFGMNKEVWRLYQSGQFVHRYAVIEDWLKEDSWFGKEDIDPGKYLDTVGVIYRFTEIMEFIKRLFENESISKSDGGRITIKLINTRNRILKILFDKMKVELFEEYKTAIDPIIIQVEFTKDEILNSSKEKALELFTKLFDEFNWENQPIEVFKNDQIKLINRRL